MELRADTERNFMHIRLTGPLTREIILDAFDAAVAEESYCSGMARLWDFSDADLKALDSHTIMDMTRHSANFPPGINDVKVAFVATRDLEYGLSRMFEAYSIDEKTTVAVFFTMEEAIEWLTSVAA